MTTPPDTIPPPPPSAAGTGTAPSRLRRWAGPRLWLLIFLAWLIWLTGALWPDTLNPAGPSSPGTLADDLTRTGAVAAFVIQTGTLHLGLGAATLGLLALLLRRWRALLASLLLAGLCLTAPLTPVLRAALPPSAPAPAGTPSVRVLTINLLFANTNLQAVLDAITAVDPDLVAFQEYAPHWHDRLTVALAARFPHQRVAMRDNLGSALYARQPLERVPAVPIPHGPWFRDNLAARWLSPLGPVLVASIHLPTPGGAALMVQNRLTAPGLVQWANQSPDPVLLLGDFNATPFGAHARTLRTAGFVDAWAAVGRGLGHTWPAESPLSVHSLLGFRIDQIWTRRLHPVSVTLAPHTGSDHRALWAELIAPTPPASPP